MHLLCLSFYTILVGPYKYFCGCITKVRLISILFVVSFLQIDCVFKGKQFLNTTI